jgi:hypothetical protein
LDFVAPDKKGATRAVGGEDAPVEKVFLDVIGHEQPELWVLREAAPKILRAALFKRAALSRIAGAKGAGAVNAEVFDEERVLRIVRKETEAAEISSTIANSEPIVWRIVTEEVRDGRVEVTAIDNYEHVVDKVWDIEQVFVGRIGRAVDVQTLHPEVGSIRHEARDRRYRQLDEAVRRTVRFFRDRLAATTR